MMPFITNSVKNKAYIGFYYLNMHLSSYMFKIGGRSITNINVWGIGGREALHILAPSNTASNKDVHLPLANNS